MNSDNTRPAFGPQAAELSGQPSPALIDVLVENLRRGQHLASLALVPEMREQASSWTDAKALTTAARLADRLGAGKLSRQWHRLNHRRHREDPLCFLYRAWELGLAIGLPRTLRMIEEWLQRPGVDPARRADLLALAAQMLGGLRDFETAWRLLDEALRLRPGNAWLVSCKASLLRIEDRREEALAAALEALSIRPEQGSALELAAGLLMDLERPEDAAKLLLEGCDRTDHAGLRWQLYVIHSEREEAEPALAWLAEYERCSQFMGQNEREALEGGRANLHLLRGDLEAAKTSARRRGGPFHERVAEHLERPEAARETRIRIPVGFVKQNHMTCAPATLAALAAWWGRAAVHTEIAERICYDGTPAFSERSWARDQGLDGREFRVTPEIARELIRRGVPFTLVTTWTTGAHLQAVIGIDDRAGLLLIRDPMSSHYSEALLDGLLKDLEAHGPRGMLVLPESERFRIEGLVLPESEPYDALHALEGALQRHDRAGAESVFSEMRERHPDHRLTWIAQGALAAYDDDPVKADEASQGLLRLFPENSAVRWRAFRSAAARSPRQDKLSSLEKQVRGPACDSAFVLELARELATDARTAPRAARLALRLLRRQPGDAQALALLANTAWTQRRFDEALSLYRLAACAADKDEGRARAYFNACQRLNRANEGIAFLRRRYQVLGNLAAAPAITLADALSDLLRSDEALALIQEARTRRPDDGSLTLHEASLHLLQGRLDLAESALQQARGAVPQNNWLRQGAELARARGDTATQVESWRRVLETEPLALDAHQHLVRAAAETDGMSAAHELLAKLTDQFPWHMGLARLRVDWLRQASAPAAEELRRILQHNPADDWAWRELALELSSRHDHAAAAEAAAESQRLAPLFAWSHSVAAVVAEASGRTGDAHALARRALTLDVTCGGIDLLLSTAPGSAERRACLDFVRGELESQSGGAQALGQFHGAAMRLLTTEELTAVLRAGHAARPDVWETWAVLAEHLLNLHDPEAYQLTREMTERFPWAPGSWRLHSQACGAARKPEERLSALRRAVAINPQWSLGGRELAEVLEREGRFGEALAEMERLAKAHPLEPANHGLLADMLSRQGRVTEAIGALERAVSVEPGYDWGWGELCRQAEAVGAPERAETAARELVRTRPHEPRSWMVLARVLLRFDRFDESLATLEEALKQWPKNIRLHDLRAIVLNESGQRREAIVACLPAVFGQNVPRELRCRQAALRIDGADYTAAEQILEDLIRTEPDYAWPKQLMYNIQRQRGNQAACVELARELVRLEPDSSMSHGLLAESLMAAGSAKEAVEPLRHALEMDPGYAFAANRLLDDLLERGDLSEAKRVAALTERFQNRPRSLVARGRLALKEGSWEEVMACQDALISSDDPDAVNVMNFWHQAIQDHGGEAIKRYQEALRRAREAGTLRNPGVAAFWAKQQTPGRVKRNVAAVQKEDLPESVREAFVMELLNCAVENGAASAAVATVQANQALLRSSTILWGTGGYVFLVAGRNKEALSWLADWRDRTDRQAWMVSNFALAGVWVSGPSSVEAAWRDVLAMGESNVWQHAAAGLAFLAAVQGKEDEAERHLANLSNLELEAQDLFTVTMARLALAAAQAGRGRARDGRQEAKRLLKQAAEVWPGGFNTSRGRFTLDELRAYLKRNGYDESFASAPKSIRRFTEPAPAGSGSWGLLAPVIFVILQLIRSCADVSPPPTSNQPPQVIRP